MFRHFPQHTKVLVNTPQDGHINLELDFDESEYTPDVIGEYLIHHGWTRTAAHPDTQQDLFQHHGMSETESGYYTWEQAVAFQLFLFMNIGAS